MTPITGTLFDGETLHRQPATLELAAGDNLLVRTEGQERIVPLDAVRVSDRLGSLPRFVYLAPRTTIETPENDAFDALLAARRRGRGAAFIDWLETHNRIAALATVLLVMFVACGLRFGLPGLARRTAAAVPAAVEEQAGRAALRTFDRMLGTSSLSRSERRRVEDQLARLVTVRPFGTKPHLEFRSMGGKYPNAFALPGGTIIVSDELVRLGVTNDEIAAVLAHELSHVERHHGIQSLLRNSYALLVVSALTGDLSTLSSLAASLPLVLLNSGYSREFEREADADALALLAAAGIDSRCFATVLEKLEKARPATGRDYSYLSTHPPTAERIRAAQKASP